MVDIADTGIVHPHVRPSLSERTLDPLLWHGVWWLPAINAALAWRMGLRLTTHLSHVPALPCSNAHARTYRRASTCSNHSGSHAVGHTTTCFSFDVSLLRANHRAHAQTRDRHTSNIMWPQHAHTHTHTHTHTQTHTHTPPHTHLPPNLATPWPWLPAIGAECFD